jgi:hypothetical protein
MLARCTLALIILLVGCDGVKQPDDASMQAASASKQVPPPGWAYHQHPYRNGVSYSWGDEADTVFAGTCDSGPVFLTGGGDYPASSQKMDIVVDGRKIDAAIIRGNHGSGVMIEDAATVRLLSDAENRIEFQVDAWVRELQPSPLIKRFVEECEAMRKVDPNADGVPG